MRREQGLFAGTAVLTVAGMVAIWVRGPAGSAGTAADRLGGVEIAGGAAQWLWIAAALLGLGWSTVTLGAAVRRREPSVDVIAWLALVGALWVGEPFAGAVIAVMLAGGALLEGRAQARARRELGLLAERMPRIARRDSAAGPVVVAVEEVAVGDRLVVGAGEVVPVDGRLSGPAVLDESALTGEPMPVERRAGEEVRSGVVNAGAAMRLTAIATARDSTYAGVVRLVEQARAGSASFVRMADRWAVAFVPLTLLLAGAAWAVSGDPVRAVAVLVVATPCPLLLAAPIAIMSGISRAARSGVVVKGGGALERLAAGQVLLIDKTGTLTEGRPRLVDVVVAPGGALAADEVLRLAASVEQSSAHVLAGAIVSAAHGRGLRPGAADEVRERHGYGIEGLVGGRRVRLGRTAAPTDDELLTVAVTVDGAPAGVLRLEDPLRPQGPRMIRALRRAGIRRVVLVTGDQGDGAAAVGRIVGADEVFAGCDPAGKLALVRAEQHRPRDQRPGQQQPPGRERRKRTIMVGDGVNDAPALAAADVGVALAARGMTASAQAADVVLTVDRIDVLADAILIARRSRGVAVAAVATGMGLAVVAMLAAAAGLLPPVAGALVQEGIDLGAIAMAMAALIPGRVRTVTLRPEDVATARRLFDEHREMRPLVERVRSVADALGEPPRLEPVRRLVTDLDRLLAHERAEEAELLPIMARALGGTEVTSGLSRTHAEIEFQVGRLNRIVNDGKAPDVIDVRRLLYGLYAILRLHNAQEEEGAFSLVPGGGS